MPTDTQSESPRRNGARHSAFANAIVLEGESRERFLELVNTLYNELQPTTHVEKMLVYKMAAAQWRQTRLWTFERTAIHSESRKQRQQSGSPKDQPTLDSLAFHSLSKANLGSHEMRFDRQFTRAHQALLKGRKVEKTKKHEYEPGK